MARDDQSSFMVMAGEKIVAVQSNVDGGSWPRPLVAYVAFRRCHVSRSSLLVSNHSVKPKKKIYIKTYTWLETHMRLEPKRSFMVMVGSE